MKISGADPYSKLTLKTGDSERPLQHHPNRVAEALEAVSTLPPSIAPPPDGYTGVARRDVELAEPAPTDRWLDAMLQRISTQARSGATEEQRQTAQTALRYYFVSSGIAIPEGLRGVLGGTDQQIASEYAKDLGFQGIQQVGKKWILLGAEPAPRQLKLSSMSLVEFGAAIAQVRFATKRAKPPPATVEVDVRHFGPDEAHLATHLASLAYQPQEVVKAQLERWGFDTKTFHWIEDKKTSTQGFVVADKKGNVFPVFRGTESCPDVKIDLSTRLVRPSWQPTVPFKAHSGFLRSLDSVWPQFKAALLSTQSAAGPHAKVMFAGHSLGAALAQLAAVRAADEGLLDGSRSSIYTIGSPRVGDQTFKDALEGLFVNAYRLANFDDRMIDRQDVVTQLPPKALGYRHAGELIRLGTKQLQQIDRSAVAIATGEDGQTISSEDIERMNDPVNDELEKLTGKELENRMRELMFGDALQNPESTVSDIEDPELSSNESDNTAGYAAPSVSAHSSGVYLDRIGVFSNSGNCWFWA